jgi:hypothetical protein
MITHARENEVHNGVLTSAYYNNLLTPTINSAVDFFRQPGESRHAVLSHVLRSAAYGFVGDVMRHPRFGDWTTARVTAHANHSEAKVSIDPCLFDALDQPDKNTLVQSTTLVEPQLPLVLDACRFVLGGTTQSIWNTAVARYASQFSTRNKLFPEGKAKRSLQNWDSYYRLLGRSGVFAALEPRVSSEPITTNVRTLYPNNPFQIR